MGSRGFTFLIIRSMVLIGLKMCMTGMIWFSPFSVISIYRALVFKNFKSFVSCCLHICLLYYTVPLQSLYSPSPLPIADFVRTPGLVLRLHPFGQKIRTELGRIKILPVLKDDFS